MRYAVKNIKIYLLDSVILDDQLRGMRCKLDSGAVKDDLLNLFAGYEQGYINKLLKNNHYEEKLIEQVPAIRLGVTKCTLFKAMLHDSRVSNESMFNYAKGLKYNNIDTVFGNQVDIEVIEVNNAHHGNILESEMIVDYILFAKVLNE